ncbi:hypothetical protein [Terrimonas pollutisoli]|uniref:hypothetical protein n=1 Tax=Terrimonas pollutisoli TaxID=3034147 RepID=UPI0023EB7F8A|nr:hypothetical protein [Terrimonas sp. H1YJ31]
MRKILLVFFLIAAFHGESFSQDGLFQFSKSYFRSDPFAGNFSDFIKHLLNDPAIQNKQVLHRTDTSLFYFFGAYKNYNPFFFKPRYIEVRLLESPIQYADSLPTDTILIYQLTAYAEPGDVGKQEVKKEFEKIHRQINKRFYTSSYKELKTGTTITGGVHNYFVGFASLAPVSVLWAVLDETNEPVLNIILRMKSSNNQAVLATSLDNP